MNQTKMRNKLFNLLSSPLMGGLRGATFFCLLLLSCGDSHNLVMSEKKTEDVLFDYHLAEAIAQSQNLDSVSSRRYYEAVLEKHGITHEQFDSTMVYYMKRADKLRDIYGRLSDRMSSEAQLQGVNGNSALAGISVEGDTANIWNMERERVFTVQQPYNLMSYHIVADSTFQAGDRFILSFNADFLYQDGSRNGYAVLSLKLANDSVITRTASLTSSIRYSLDVADKDTLGIKELRGFIMQRQPNAVVERNSSTLRMMVVHNISLIRMHTEVKEKAEEKAEVQDVKKEVSDDKMLEKLPEDIEVQELKPLEEVN